MTFILVGEFCMTFGLASSWGYIFPREGMGEEGGVGTHKFATANRSYTCLVPRIVHCIGDISLFHLPRF